MKQQTKYDPNERTLHGDNIANQIPGEDAYGVRNTLTPADLWNILDSIQSHWIDSEEDQDPEADFIGDLMAQVVEGAPPCRGK